MTLGTKTSAKTRRWRYLAAFCAFLAFPGPVGAADKYFSASDGVRLHYAEFGRGPTLLLVPGWTMPADIWEPQIRHFEKSFRVIAFDPRGQGKSDVARDGYTAERRARDILELIERVGEPVVLIGWSLGVLDSLTAVDLAGTKLLRALVLVDNSIGEEPPPKSDPTFLSRLKKDRAATTERFVRGMFRTPRSDDYLRRLVASAMRVPTDAAVALLSYPYPRQHWKEVIYRTDRPILYVVTPRFRGQAENLKNNHPNARVEVFEEAGHALFVDAPERFNRLVEDFLVHQVKLGAATGDRP